MKIKLLLLALFLVCFQNFFAQENHLSSVLDSVKIKTIALEKQKNEEKIRPNL